MNRYINKEIGKNKYDSKALKIQRKYSVQGNGFVSWNNTRQMNRYNKLIQKSDKYEYKIHNRGTSAFHFDVFSSALSTVAYIIIIYVLFNFLTNSNFEFSFIGLVNQLNSIPTINLSSIGAWDFPDWLNWLEPIAKALGIVGSCIINIALMVIWIIMLCFGISI